MDGRKMEGRKERREGTKKIEKKRREETGNTEGITYLRSQTFVFLCSLCPTQHAFLLSFSVV